MNRKNILCAMAAMALAVTFTACDNSNKMDEKGAAAAAAAEKSGAQLIAFVEIDSLQEKYEFCKEMKGKLEQKQKNAEAALASQEKNLQAAAKRLRTSREPSRTSKTNIWLLSSVWATNCSLNWSNTRRRFLTASTISLLNTTKIRSSHSS